jgi:transcriptional regulator with XRE-family HTH domain
MEFDRAGFDREVGLRLQRARRERGITQEELARRIGLPRPSYANIESGRQRIPLDVIWRAAIVLGISVAVLVPEPQPGRRDPVAVVPIVASVLPANAEIANSTASAAANAKE